MPSRVTSSPRPASRSPQGWSGLFAAAFRESRNPMVLVDASRLLVDVNGALLALIGYRRDDLLGHPIYDLAVGGPMLAVEEWEALLETDRFTGEIDLTCADGTTLSAQWAATPETITGRRLVLGVALSTSRWGSRFRRVADLASETAPLSPRELEVLRLVADGRSGPEIADELRIAHDTVRTHVRNAMTKTGARSRAHLVAKALGDGLALR